MQFFDYILASALPSKKDFKILKKEGFLSLNYTKNPKPLKGLTQGFFDRLKKLNLNQLEKEYKKSKKYKVLRLDDKNYPKLLLEIADSPAYLFILGESNVLDKPALAFVGSRRATSYGKKVVFNLIYNLDFPWAIVSGLAMGIDSFSHQAALEADKKTIAVLGSGFHHLYPAFNKRLAQNIIKSGGVIISEYPPHFEPEAFYFPARNRIIAGLSQATIVIEAAQKSGSLITASLAAKYGRDVLAVPNEVFALTSVGCFSLIKQGAKPIFIAQDIEEDYGRLFPKFKNELETDPLGKFLQTPKHIDEIAKFLKASVNDAVSKISILEMENKVKNLGAGFYQKI